MLEVTLWLPFSTTRNPFNTIFRLSQGGSGSGGGGGRGRVVERFVRKVCKYSQISEFPTRICTYIISKPSN